MAVKVLFLFFISFGVCANGVKMLGSNRCTWGPSYWCKDYGKAVECDAVQHCRENVWKSKRTDIDPCTLCELAIKRAENILNDSAVQEQFLDFLKDVCDNAGLGPFAGQCKDIVTKHEPDIIKNLKNILADPEKVCAKIGMCEARDDQRMIAALFITHANPRIHNQPFDGVKLTDSQKCLMCRAIKRDLERIPNRTKRMDVSLQKVCNGKSASDKKECQRAITKLVPVIVSLMKTKVNQVCINYNTRSCKVTPRTPQQDLMAPKKLQDIGCDMCIYFMNEAETFLRNDSLTEKQFEKMLLVLCNEFKYMAFQCKQMVKQYGSLLYELLTELKPYQVCQEIMMCPATAPAELASDPRCFLGASFWCASLKNAERCSALQYCKSHIWNAQNFG